jgi:autotransporter-associated beta strand protein
MKPKSLSLAAILPLAAISHTQAQSTWTGATLGEWGTASNWDGGVPNAPGAIANINTALTVNISDTGTAGTYPYTFGTIATTITTSNVVLGTTNATTDILTAETASGVPEFSVASGGGMFFYANLEGTQGFNKAGAGKLTFRFNGAAQTYSGDITISGGILGINQDSSLGDADNDITIAGAARLLAEPGSNTGTITLPDTRTITLGGFQSQIGSSPAVVELIIDGDVSESAPGNGLVKTDAGKLTLRGYLSYTGETRIAGGTLALAGAAELPSDQNLRFTGNAVAGTLDLGGVSQTIRTIVMDQVNANRTITGGGSLTIDGDANLALTAANGVSYDFSGINSFTFDKSTRNFNFQTTNAASVVTLNDLNLAKSGAGGGTNIITAAAFQVGGGTSDGNNGNTARLHLGTVNTINANTVKIGAFNAAGVVDFQAGLTSPSLTLRAANGTSAVTTVTVGETSSGSRHGDGTLNLTGGSLDAVATEVLLGRHTAGTNTVHNTSAVTMPAGTLDVGTMVMAQKTGGGTPTLTATFTQEGGNVTIGTLTMGVGDGTEAARLLPTYRLWGGTLAVTTVQSGGGIFASNSSRNLILRNGTLTNKSGADLTISGITVTVAGNANTVVAPTPGRKVVLASDVTYSARLNSANNTSGVLTVNGPLDLSASPAFGILDDATNAAQLAPGTKLKLIDYSLGSLTGTFASLPEGATVNVTKGAITNSFVIKYADDGGTAVTLSIPSEDDENYSTWAIAKGIEDEPFDGDYDNDGISNGMEYALGKNPLTSSQPPGVLAGNTITFTKGAEAITNADVSWIIETSTTLELGSWTAEVNQPAGDSAATISYTFTPGSPAKKFARLKVVQVP